jgi:hypothetical protein
MQSIIKPKRLAAFEDMIQSNIKTKILGYMTHQQIQPNYQEYLSLNTALQSGDAPMETDEGTNPVDISLFGS